MFSSSFMPEQLGSLCLPRAALARDKDPEACRLPSFHFWGPALNGLGFRVKPCKNPKPLRVTVLRGKLQESQT